MSRRHLAAVGGAAVVILLAWFMFLWSPKAVELTDARDRRTAANEQASQLQLRLERLKDAKQRTPDLQVTAERLRSAVPATPNLAQFLLDTNDAAAKAGVNFLSVSPTPPAASTTGPTEVQLALSIKGGYFQTLDFMNRLLDLPRIVVLDTVSVTAAAASAGAPELAVSLTGRMFTTEVPASATPTTAPATTATTGTSAPNKNVMVG
ncbi:MAG: Tfp pilus assembly protein PilO [Acidimicrobiales bacterium]|nr:Tfp pilus assembly protein PilO [Acidimicrobiales bacterium]